MFHQVHNVRQQQKQSEFQFDGEQFHNMQQQQKQSEFQSDGDCSVSNLYSRTADDSAVDLGNDSLLDLNTPLKYEDIDHASISPNPTNAPPTSPAASAKSTSPESGRGSVTPQSSPDMPVEPPKKRLQRIRTNYTPVQLRTLEQAFTFQKYPDGEMIESLSLQIGIEESKLKVWFQNKRARRKRESYAMANAANIAKQFGPNPFMPMSSAIPRGPLVPFAHNNMVGVLPTPFPVALSAATNSSSPRMPYSPSQTNNRQSQNFNFSSLPYT